MYFVLGKKEKCLIAAAIILVLILVLFCIPRSTKINYSVPGVKVSESGYVMDYIWITMNGKKLDYLLGPSKLRVRFTEANPFNTLQIREHGSTGLFGYISTIKGSDIQYTSYTTYIVMNGEKTFGRIGFSPDLKRWIIYNDDEGFYYLLGDVYNDSTEEMLAYFRAFLSAE